MEDKKAIRLLKRNNEKALEDIIYKYTGYVAAVILNQLGSFGENTLVEELSSEVFFSLWQNRLKIKGDSLKGWLGATARNKARDYLRKMNITECLEEDFIDCKEVSPFESLEEKEQRKVLQNALRQMEQKDREIIIRYYYYNQTIGQLSQEMALNFETAKSRLRRGRTKLKKILEEGGYLG